jgi:hypothetical protein
MHKEKPAPTLPRSLRLQLRAPSSSLPLPPATRQSTYHGGRIGGVLCDVRNVLPCCLAPNGSKACEDEGTKKGQRYASMYGVASAGTLFRLISGLKWLAGRCSAPFQPSCLHLLTGCLLF